MYTSVLSVEVQAAGAGPLQLEEIRVGGQRPSAVEKACRLLAARDGGQHRTEEPDAVDVNGRGAKIRTDRFQRRGVALAQRLVVVGPVRRFRELGRQAHLGEGLL